jgi:cadmium resistance protein CadD (predicted permease)
MDNERRKHRHYVGVLGPVVLIIVGVVFLLERTGIITRQMISQWWPLLLIFIGIWILLARFHRSD